MKTMSTNISKQKREDLLNKIKEIRAFISAAPQDENTGNLHEGQLTDHAYKPDTDFLIFIK